MNRRETILRYIERQLPIIPLNGKAGMTGWREFEATPGPPKGDP